MMAGGMTLGFDSPPPLTFDNANFSSLSGGRGSSIGGRGMDPVIGSALIAGGSELLGSLASRIFGSGDRKRLRRFDQFLQGQYGQEVFSPQDQQRIFGYLRKAQSPSFNFASQGINKRLGLDSGVAQGELARLMQSTEFGTRADLAQLGTRLRAQRDNTILGLRSNVLSSLA
jgi:hypothetical protein